VKLRGALASVVAAVAVAGCSSVVSGHGSAVPRPSTPAGGGGFPATSSSASSVPSLPGTSAPPSSRPGALESPDGDFSVLLPDGWTDGSDRLSGIAVTGYFGPTADGFATNVNVVREPVSGMDLAQYYEATIANVRNTLRVTALSQPTYRQVDGENALDYSFRDKQVGRTLQQRQTLVLHDGKGYVITYTALPSSYAASLADADAIIDSWQWG
jgi:hypothetical protein